jgi:hypothetical protein
MLEDIKGIKNYIGSKMFYNYIFELRFIGKHDKKEVGGQWKGPKYIFFEGTTKTQKDIIGAKNVNASIGEN